MSDKGAELNRRVWTLFEKAGFETMPSSVDPAEAVVSLSHGRRRTLDLSASVGRLDVRIIGQNTTASDLGESFTTYVHDFSELMRITKADGGLFVFTRRAVSEQDKLYAEENRIRVWGEEELRYYEALVHAIREYAKYEMIHSFGISTAEETSICNVLGLRFSQPYSNSDPKLFLFTSTPEKLLKTCVIYRKAQGSGDAYQRMLKKSRLPA